MLRIKKCYLLLTAILVFLCVLTIIEVKTSRIQAWYFSRFARRIQFSMAKGPNSVFHYVAEGPYDSRLGYRELPNILETLKKNGGIIEEQARWSDTLKKVIDDGIFPPYHEKSRAGLRILDSSGKPIFETIWPKRFYFNYYQIPKFIVDALANIENRGVLASKYPFNNPVIEWDRLALQLWNIGLRSIGFSRQVNGASTLATQLEKFRHSQDGRTRSVGDKFKQMKSAVLRVYYNGENTAEARRQIILNYLNSIPLGGKPGYGEVIGLGDGLWAWFGEDFKTINEILKDINTPSLAHGIACRKVLALLLAQRRPKYYLLDHPEILEFKINQYAFLLKQRSIISPMLYDVLSKTRLNISNISHPDKITFSERKGADAIRTYLLRNMSIDNFYQLDRIDMDVKSTLDGLTQVEISNTLQQLVDPVVAKQSGLEGVNLLHKNNSTNIKYSFVLYEQKNNTNLLRVLTDNHNGPFDLNNGMKLELGSTAKLRTLVTYLELIADIYTRYSYFLSRELKQIEVPSKDHLTQWTINWLITHHKRQLSQILNDAMERHYSASPYENFLTGGGIHRFTNFKHEDDLRIPTVRKAFSSSINLVFVRMMRDIINHLSYQIVNNLEQLMKDSYDSRRDIYLKRFVDIESRVLLERFYKKYYKFSPESAFQQLLQLGTTPKMLAVIYRTIKPESNLLLFSNFMRSVKYNDLKNIKIFYQQFNRELWNWSDLGYLSHIHPLELWLVAFLQKHPKVTFTELVRASSKERVEIYSWLFKTKSKQKQDKRIRQIIEVDAFINLHNRWRRLGYPFQRLVPSYATALGSSGDRPEALAKLIGIILADGLSLPNRRVEKIHFASNTPYETIVKFSNSSPLRVLRPEVAREVRKALISVIDSGTGIRLKGVFKFSNGALLTAGGKTGTGDNRRYHLGNGFKKTYQVMNRTGTFVFMIGDRWFGVITAFVDGPTAASYRFTSSLPVQVLRVLSSKLMPLFQN